jgi:phosphoserine phosphatase
MVLALVFKHGLRGLFLSDNKHRLIGHLVKNRNNASVKRSLEMFGWLVKRYMRPDIMKLLAEHTARNAMIIIATASPDFAVQYIFSDRSVTIVGTVYEIREGQYTGERLSPVCIGEEKLNRVKNVLSDNGASVIDIAYSDHCTDLALLRFAKKAVFVYPDEKTRGFVDVSRDEVIG